MNARIVANNEIFSSNPEGYIKSILGNEINNLSYAIQDTDEIDQEINEIRNYLYK